MYYDGQVIASKNVASTVFKVGGKLAYQTYQYDKGTVGKKGVVLDGKEYGAQYDSISSATEVGGKLAYAAKNNGKKYIIVWDGKEYGTDFNNNVSGIHDVGGKLAFIGTNKSTDVYGHDFYQSNIVIGDKQYDQYWYIQDLSPEKGEHFVLLVEDRPVKDNRDTPFYFVDGSEFGRGFQSLTYRYAFIGDKFAFSGTKNGKTVIVYDGKEIDGMFSRGSGPYNIKGQLAYIATNTTNDTSQLIIGGQPVGPIMSGLVPGDVAVSDGGKVAIQIGNKNKNKDIPDSVYLDGKEVYRGSVGHQQVRFFGEKLLFDIVENRIYSIWYDGKKFGQSLDGIHDYRFVLINGKLNIAMPSGLDSYKYDLLIEQ